MTIAEILDQAKALSPQERRVLAELLLDTLNTSETASPRKYGAH
jgi:hypothetical protein